jgi:hypothetical protein
MYPKIQFKNVTKLLYTRNHITFQDQFYEITGFRTQLVAKRCLAEPTVKVKTPQKTDRRDLPLEWPWFSSRSSCLSSDSQSLSEEICICVASVTLVKKPTSSWYMNLLVHI